MPKCFQKPIRAPRSNLDSQKGAKSDQSGAVVFVKGSGLRQDKASGL